jgi:excisionase family DNA binding protein
VIVIVDDAVGRHVAVALLAHIRTLRRDRVPVPTALADLVALCARGGQRRPEIDGTPSVDDRVDVDQLAVDYRGAAERLSVSDRSVRRLVAEGELPAVLVGGVKRIRVADLEQYVEALPAAGTPARPELENA